MILHQQFQFFSSCWRFHVVVFDRFEKILGFYFKVYLAQHRHFTLLICSPWSTKLFSKTRTMHCWCSHGGQFLWRIWSHTKNQIWIVKTIYPRRVKFLAEYTDDRYCALSCQIDCQEQAVLIPWLYKDPLEVNPHWHVKVKMTTE